MSKAQQNNGVLADKGSTTYQRNRWGRRTLVYAGSSGQKRCKCNVGFHRGGANDGAHAQLLSGGRHHGSEATYRRRAAWILRMRGRAEARVCFATSAAAVSSGFESRAFFVRWPGLLRPSWVFGQRGWGRGWRGLLTAAFKLRSRRPCRPVRSSA